MVKAISLLFILVLSFSASGSIMDRLLAYRESEATYNDLPCMDSGLYEQIKIVMDFDDQGLAGSLCGDGSLKEKIGRFVNMFWGEVSFALDEINENPEEALAEPASFVIYPQLRCITEKKYQHYKDLLGFSDQMLEGGLCDGSLKARFGKLMNYFITAFDYYKRALTMGLDSSLEHPYKLLISDILSRMKYEGSLTPDADAPLLTGLTHYAQLPCISEKMYHEIKDVIGVDDTDLEGELCGDDSNKERFGKLLLYLKKLAIRTPHNWKGGAGDALANPLNYIADGTIGDMRFEDEHGAAIASNFLGRITIYKRFFLMEPIDAIGVLVHEARHSASKDPGHETCTAGDRARQNGACDKWLDTGDEAGAYSYNVSFYYGIAKYGLSSQVSDEDREFLRSVALSLIARRFNGVPDFLGLPFEMVHVLNSDGRHHYFHPIIKKLITIDHQDDNLGNIVNLKFNRVKNGIRIFNEDGELFQNDNFDFPLKKFDENIVNVPIRDIEKLTGKKTSITYFVTKENEIWNRAFDLEKQIYSSVRSPFQYPHDNIISLIHGNDTGRYALLEGGLLLRFKPDNQIVDGEDNMVEAEFQDPAKKGWNHVTGGVLYNNLFGVNRDGSLYQYHENGPVKIESDRKITTYLEGTNFSLIQKGKYRLDVKRYGEEKAVKIEFESGGGYGGSYQPASIVSSSYSRHFKPGKRYQHQYNKMHQNFIQNCNVIKVETDPWTGKGMGLTKNNELVFEGSEFEECMKYERHGSIEVTDFKFSGTSVQEPGTFSTTALEIFTEGKWRKIYPYDWREFAVD